MAKSTRKVKPPKQVVKFPSALPPKAPAVSPLQRASDALAAWNQATPCERLMNKELEREVLSSGKALVEAMRSAK